MCIVLTQDYQNFNDDVRSFAKFSIAHVDSGYSVQDILSGRLLSLHKALYQFHDFDLAVKVSFCKSNRWIVWRGYHRLY